MGVNLPPDAVSESKPVEILGWVASGATALVGALALINGVPPVLIAIVGAVGIVATKLLAYATTKKVTPWEDVISKATEDGRAVAGPAANQVTPESEYIRVGQELELPKAA